MLCVNCGVRLLLELCVVTCVVLLCVTLVTCLMFMFTGWIVGDVRLSFELYLRVIDFGGCLSFVV